MYQSPARSRSAPRPTLGRVRDRGAEALRFKLVEWLIGKLNPSADGYAARIGPLLIAPELGTESGLIFNSKACRTKPSKKLTPERVAEFLRATEELLVDLPNSR